MALYLYSKRIDHEVAAKLKHFGLGIMEDFSFGKIWIIEIIVVYLQ